MSSTPEAFQPGVAAHRSRSRGWLALAAMAGLLLGASAGHADDGTGDGGGRADAYARGPNGGPAWADDAAGAARAAPVLRYSAPQSTPPVVPVFQTVVNPHGTSATYQPAGPTLTANNAFFAALGTNGRTCASCHAASAGWSITPAQVQALFFRTQGTDPLFQPVDGTNCSTDDVSSLPARLRASSLLLSKGLIRIFEKLPAPPTLQFGITQVQDPYGCNTNPATGLTSYGPGATSAGFVSIYRRPLPATNLAFLSTILADGREPTLAQQAIDANRIHAQSSLVLTAASPEIQQMVAFELGLTSAQTSSLFAGTLTGDGARGGPIALAAQPFYLGINDAFGADPTGQAFNQDAYSLYSAWESGASGYGEGHGWTGRARGAIARGETIFNERSFTISGVAGLNDLLGQPAISGTCSTCHDAPNAGTHSLNAKVGSAMVTPGALVDTGVTVPGAVGIDQSALPVFTLQCNAGPLAGQSFTTTDPGRAILSGQCSDINRLKVPTLRNLAARPPYFHNGGAATLGNVVDFYNARFAMGLSRRDREDLIAFLNAL